MQDGECFTIDEAANIMLCKRRTVYRLLDDGWLIRPPGNTKKETGGRVTKKSLYQFVIVDRLSHLPNKTLKAIRRERKVFEKSECQIEEAKHLSICEGTDNSHPSPYPLPQGEGTHHSQQPERCRHHDFAEQRQFSFGWRARQLMPDDPSLQDDLMQEMSLAVLEFDEPASSEFLFEVATNRAKMYRRYEARRGMVSLRKARFATDNAARKKASLNAFIEELEQRGVPREWIEEVIDWRLKAA